LQSAGQKVAADPEASLSDERRLRHLNKMAGVMMELADELDALFEDITTL
jgi:hypothetical protein